MLDRGVEPSVAIEQEPITSKEPSGSQSLGIGWSNFIAGQHLDDHPIVGLVFIQRLHDPIPPSPDVALAVANLLSVSGPVAVSPDVHPMSPPSFAIPRALEQVADDFLVGVPRIVVEERLQLLASWRHANQIQIDSAQQDGLVSRPHGQQSKSLVVRGQECVDWIPHPSTILDLWRFGANGLLVGPMISRIARRLLFGRRRPLVEPRPHEFNLLSS